MSASRPPTKSQASVDWLRHGSRATGTAWQVLAVFCWYVNDKTGLSWPSVDTIAAETNSSRRAVFRAIAQLEKLGELEAVSRRRYGATSYRLPLATSDAGDTPDEPTNDAGSTPGPVDNEPTSDDGGTPGDFRSDAGGSRSDAGGSRSADFDFRSDAGGTRPLEDLDKTSQTPRRIDAHELAEGEDDPRLGAVVGLIVKRARAKAVGVRDGLRYEAGVRKKAMDERGLEIRALLAERPSASPEQIVDALESGVPAVSGNGTKPLSELERLKVAVETAARSADPLDSQVAQENLAAYLQSQAVS